MHEALDPLLKTLPPKTKHALDRAINACSARLGLPSDWVLRWLSFTIVADALARHRIGEGHSFELKGGAAIELRLRRLHPGGAPTDADRSASQPRATKDLDATFRGVMADLEGAVRAALTTPHPAFQLGVELETPDAANMRRFRVRVAYLEPALAGGRAPRHLNSVKLEVSCYEGTPRPPEMVPAFPLSPFGLEGPSELPCLPLVKQIAQKLHAVTERRDGDAPNDRFRDLVDLVMLSQLEPASPDLRAVCEETFTIRQKQLWPPAVVLYPTWVEPLKARALEMGLAITDADEIAGFVQGYIESIARAT